MLSNSFKYYLCMFKIIIIYTLLRDRISKFYFSQKDAPNSILKNTSIDLDKMYKKLNHYKLDNLNYNLENVGLKYYLNKYLIMDPRIDSIYRLFLKLDKKYEIIIRCTIFFNEEPNTIHKSDSSSSTYEHIPVRQRSNNTDIQLGLRQVGGWPINISFEVSQSVNLKIAVQILCLNAILEPKISINDKPSLKTSQINVVSPFQLNDHASDHAGYSPWIKTNQGSFNKIAKFSVSKRRSQEDQLRSSDYKISSPNFISQSDIQLQKSINFMIRDTITRSEGQSYNCKKQEAIERTIRQNKESKKSQIWNILSSACCQCANSFQKFSQPDIREALQIGSSFHESFRSSFGQTQQVFSAQNSPKRDPMSLNDLSFLSGEGLRGYLQYWDINDLDNHKTNKDKNIISHQFKSHELSDISKKGLKGKIMRHLGLNSSSNHNFSQQFELEGRNSRYGQDKSCSNFKRSRLQIEISQVDINADI
ncbi:UNKNOWN [Stylonychia lemnae]|uniref:Uncharacterized protein n=1 Tax=Stylonychia lemnae TaxID=5949 RepID=A0A077ZW38_STYLE|nr:UNKNOWN [Stylonychia lemnae]|eukprot:CDW73480.1 UNKNOWN [Stylonychia lemnae]